MDDAELEPPISLAQAARIVDTLNRHDVQYVVIGAFAAQLHGVVLPRLTRDIDATPLHAPANLERIATALEELQALIRVPGHEPGVHFPFTAEFLSHRSVYALTCEHGRFDLTFTPSGTAGYDDLSIRARRLDLEGIVAPVADLGDVIRSKRTANRPKDRQVLPSMVEFALAHGVDPYTIPARGRPPIPTRAANPEHARRIYAYLARLDVLSRQPEVPPRDGPVLDR
jgi:hypothetical protein